MRLDLAFSKSKATVAGGLFVDFTKKLMLPTVDNLRNLFLTPTTEMLSFFQHVISV